MGSSLGGIIIPSGVTFDGIPQPGGGSAFGSWKQATLDYVSAADWETVVNLTTVDDGPGEMEALSGMTVEFSLGFGYMNTTLDAASLLQGRGVAGRDGSNAPTVLGSSTLSAGNVAGDLSQTVMSGNDVLIQCKTSFSGNITVICLWRVMLFSLPANP